MRFPDLRTLPSRTCETPQDFRDVADIGVLTFESERRRAGYCLQSWNFHQSVDDVFSKAVAKILLVLIAAHVSKRQNSNRWRPSICSRHVQVYMQQGGFHFCRTLK